jgi:pimeloyl-ACP methyl ester carboxylesterase
MILLSCDNTDSERFSEIQGRKQHILDLGEGEPVVVFLSGRGSRLETFTLVQTEISKVARTFSYDRAGLGKSEMLDTVRSFDNMIKELNLILDKESIEPPYILVGHSLGGFIARYYYHLHQEKVAGIVLIDPGHEDDIQVLLSSRTGTERKILDSLIHAINPEWSEGRKYEYKYSDYNDRLMKGITQPTNIPLTLLISTKWDEKEIGITREDVDSRTKLMTDWVKDIKGAKTVLTDNSGHFIHKEEPELVTKEIKEMIELVKSNRR